METQEPDLIQLPPGVVDDEYMLLMRFSQECERQPYDDPKRRRSEALRRFPGEVAQKIKAAWFARQAENAEFHRKHEEETRQRRMEMFLRGVGPRLADATVDNFELTKDPKYRPAQEAALTTIKEYIKRIPEHRKNGVGLWLRGSCGAGKDHLAVAAAKAAISEHGFSVVAVCGAELFRAMRDAMKGDRESQELESYTRADILLLSDPLPVFGQLTTYQSQTLYDVVEQRYRNMLPNWTTLNVTSHDEADQRLSPAIADRLRHDAIDIECRWPSFRTERDQ